MPDADPAARRFPSVLTESRGRFVAAIAARANRFRLLFWIGVMLLPQLIHVLLGYG